MERTRTLVVSYSRGGNTRRLARAIAKELGADHEEIRDRADRAGITGYLRCVLEAVLEVSTEIAPLRRDLSHYDLVVVGTPVWATSVSSPVRTFLWLERRRLPAVAFFATLGGVGSERAFGQMRALAGRAPAATLAVRENELARGGAAERVEEFAGALRAAAARRTGRRGKLRAVS
jgi:NAD(P)H-dependent FMN reductase